MDNQNKRRVSISAIRRANESLRIRNSDGKFLDQNTNSGQINIQTIHSGFKYEINLSERDIRLAFAKSLKTANLHKK